jgi:hypothetical protein
MLLADACRGRSGQGRERTHPDVRPRLQKWVERWTERLAENPFKRAWRAIAVATVVVTVVGGALVRLTDPASISSLPNGFW